MNASGRIPDGAKSEEGRLRHSENRRKMVEEQIAARGVTDERVLEALRTVSRHRFVPDSERETAYEDRSVPLAAGHREPPPYETARMAEWLVPTPGARVLRLGTGSGYLEAILATCGCDVYALSRVPALHEMARRTLDEGGYGVSLRLEEAERSAGWPEAAPFQRMLLPGAGAELPAGLDEQLEEGGLAVAPSPGPPASEPARRAPRLYRYRKVEGTLRREAEEGGDAFDPSVPPEPRPEETGESPRPEERIEEPREEDTGALED